MSNRRVEVKLIPVVAPEGSETNFIEVQLSYRMGGLNPFTHREQSRGYYLSVTPIDIQQHNGYQTRSFMGFSGICRVIEEANRFSESRFNKVLNTLDQDLVNSMIERVMNNHQLRFAEEQAA